MLESGACQDGCIRLEITIVHKSHKPTVTLVSFFKHLVQKNNSHYPGLVAQILSLTKMFSMSCLFPDTAYGQ